MIANQIKTFDFCTQVNFVISFNYSYSVCYGRRSRKGLVTRAMPRHRGLRAVRSMSAIQNADKFDFL